jgi:hypothetical protein
MSLTQLLTVCIAALTIPFRSIPTRARVVQTIRRHKLTPALVRAGVISTAIAFCLFNYTAAQETATTSDSHDNGSGKDHNQCEHCDNQPAHTSTLDPNSIMGFENPDTWIVRIDGFFPDFNVKSTKTRTQGSAAFAVADPPSLMTLTSRRVSSTATALTGIGNKGALLQLDVQLPAPSRGSDRDDRGDCDPTSGSIEGFVSVRSIGVHRVSLGHVSLKKYRTGIYNTVGFSVPESVSSKLNGADFSDMIFEFEVSSPGRVRGTYLFDNLRVHSVELVQSPTGSAPPAGYGGSVDLVVPGNAPVTQTFDLGPVQIPSGFHLKKGVAGSTTVQLQYGLDGTPALTCTYKPDTTDTTHESYILKSCTDTYEPGDLVSANWVSLEITGGAVGQQLNAQLALSPLGDLTGSGLIPAMPTFWGSSDACTPAPVSGTIVTTSKSCAAQTAQANQIVTTYFDEADSERPSPNWIVAPVPVAALLNGDGTPTNTSPTSGPNNVPFDTGGDLNPGGSFDAYWKLSGNLNPTAVAGTDENLTHFDAAFTAHTVLFGDDVDVVDAKVTADTDSGETTPSYKAATSTGTLGFYVFGEEIPSGGLSFSPSTGFSVDPSWNQEYDLPPIQIWIFDITLGALVDADLNAQGSAALSGADLSVTPNASIGAHVSGGINLGVASGSVDAKVNLITLSTPTTAQVKWVLDNTPQVCATTLNGSLNSNLNLSSGGGEVDLDASLGDCPICYTHSWTLFKWNPLISKSWSLLDDTIDVQLFALPPSLCPYSATATIVSPTNGASLSSGLPITLIGSAGPTDNTIASTSTYNWTYTKGANAGSITINPAGANGPNPVVTFGPPTSGNTSTWTIGLTATTTVTGVGGSPNTVTSTATPVTVTVTNLQKGVYIGEILSGPNGPAVPDPTVGGAYNMGNVPLPVTVTGIVSGASGTLNTTFTVALCNDGTAACTNPISPMSLPVTGGSTTTPSAVWSSGYQGGYYKITMTTTAGGSNFGTASAIVYGTLLL